MLLINVRSRNCLRCVAKMGIIVFSYDTTDTVRGSISLK